MSFFYIRDETVDGDAHVLGLGGELDLYAAPRMKQRLDELIDEGTSHLVVDLSESEFIDSTAMGVLVGAVKRVHEAGGRLVVVCDNQHMLRIFEIVGMERVLPIHDSRRSALSALTHVA